MKYIKYFFENNKNGAYDTWDVMDIVDQNIIEKYFKDQIDITFDQICETNPEFIWNGNYIDEEKFKDNIISEKLDNMEYYKLFKFDDFNINSFLYFFSEDKNKKLLKYFTNKKLKDLILDDFIEIFKKDDELKREFYKFMLEDYCWDKTPMQIAEIKYSDLTWNIMEKDIQTPVFSYQSNVSVHQQVLQETFNLIYMYVDDNKVVDDYIEEIDFSIKHEYFAQDLPYSYYLQELIFDKYPNVALKLFDIIEIEMVNNEKLPCFAFEYKFQKEYIRMCLEKNISVANALKNIDHFFKINDKIKNEYKNDMYIIDSEKFNI